MIRTGVRALAWGEVATAALVTLSLAGHAQATVSIAGRAIGSSSRQMETGAVTDVDGNNYRTVRIGTQWWMAEDLRVTRDPAGKVIQAAATLTTHRTSPRTGGCTAGMSR
jgi:predicted lipase